MTRPPSSCTIGSGDEPTIVASGCRTKYMYGLGLTCRSTRYTSNGSACRSRSKRCASTTWKMSPARMCSFAASTAPLVRVVAHRRLHVGQRLAGIRRRDGRVGQRRAEIGAASSMRTIAASYAASMSSVGRSGFDRDALDEVHALPPVVECGEAADHGQHGVRETEVVARHARQMLDLAHDVVAEIADEAAVQRRQIGHRWRAVGGEHPLDRCEHTLISRERRRPACP